jgi:hypothetical protein
MCGMNQLVQLLDTKHAYNYTNLFFSIIHCTPLLISCDRDLIIVTKFPGRTGQGTGSWVDSFEWVLQDGCENDPAFLGQGTMPSTPFYVTMVLIP